MRILLTIVILILLGCTKTHLDLTDPALVFPDRKPTLEMEFTINVDTSFNTGITDLFVFGEIVLARSGKTLTAFSATTNTQLWHTTLTAGGFGSQIQVLGDKIYCFDVNRDLLVIDFNSGQLLEERSLTREENNQMSWITYKDGYLYFIDYQHTVNNSYKNLVFCKYGLEDSVKEEFLRIDSVYAVSPSCKNLACPMILDSRSEKIYFSTEFCNHVELTGGKYMYDWKKDSLFKLSSSVHQATFQFENFTLFDDKFLIFNETDNKTVGLDLETNNYLWRKGQGGGNSSSVFPSYFGTYVFNQKVYSWDMVRDELHLVDHLSGNPIWKQYIISQNFALAMVENTPSAFFISTLTTGGKSVPVIRIIDMNSGKYLIEWGPYELENFDSYVRKNLFAVVYSPSDGSCYIASNKTIYKYKLPSLK